jgi:SAM-dependent methyltransferase
MSQDFRLYNSADVWDQEIQLGQRNLLRALRDFWPAGVSTALDVGCGDGKLTRVLAAETGVQIVGFDNSAEALSRLPLPTVLGDAAEMPFDDAHFDLVFSTDTLEHVPDQTHEQVWSEIFRVARKHVLVGVPFREELLDASALCPQCGKSYHVNWHQRSYDLESLHRRAPAGWHVQATVISGESWPEALPLETQLRRKVLGEWSGWCMSVCPHCGAAGTEPPQPRPLPAMTAAALGQLVYESLNERRVWRSHSEILVVYGKSSSFTLPRLAAPASSRRSATLAEPASQPLHEHLVNYPQVARCVKAADGGLILQFPAYKAASELTIERSPGFDGSVNASVEDGLGVLHTGVLLPQGLRKVTIQLPRDCVPGLYGILLRTAQSDALAAFQLGAGPIVSWLEPSPGQVAYQRIGHGAPALYVQAVSDTWLDDTFFTGMKDVPDVAGEWGRILSALEQLAARQQALLGRELDESRRLLDRQNVALQNAEGARLLLEQRAREADALAVNVQNLEAERRALLDRAEEADRLAVQLQNLHAERALLLARISETDQLTVQVQNLSAQSQALEQRAREADRLAVQLQNLNTELHAVQEQLRVCADERDALIRALDDVRSRTEYKIGHALRSASIKRRS